MNKFNIGDIVKIEDEEIGIIEWTENKCMGIKEEDGYAGINILTHTRGFVSPVSMDKCTKSNIKEVIGYYELENRRLHSIIAQEKINQKELEKERLINEHLKALLKLYI